MAETELLLRNSVQIDHLGRAWDTQKEHYQFQVLIMKGEGLKYTPIVIPEAVSFLNICSSMQN